MAFEVFDDVAFYWFLLAILVGFIYPISTSFLKVLQDGRIKPNWTRGVTSCNEKNARIDAALRRETMAKAFGWRGAMFMVAWVMLIYLGGKLTAMQGEEMYSFNPYKILEVEEGSEMSDVKKSFRKLSLKYHPDKNAGNPEANDMFIKVKKAYDVLTDDATRENYEKYGNPDGYHGTSVTIGLPSWLTNKENELAILVAYFLVIIIIIPVVVGLWWRNSSKYIEGGVMEATVFRFWRQIQETTATKYIPGILASAIEFTENAPCNNASAKDLQKLHAKVSPHFVKNQGDNVNDIMKIKTLLYAHLLREEIPPSLEKDMSFVLKHAHHLLNGLLNITTEQRFVASTMNVIECSQLLTQGLWFHSNQLLQLPWVDQKEIKLLNKYLGASKSTGSAIEKVKELGGEKRREALPHLEEAQHCDIDLFLMRFPDIEITWDAKVEDEDEELQENDLATLHVKIERKHLPDDLEWQDSDDEEEPDDSIFEDQLKGYEEGTTEWEEQKERLMDEWRDAYFERQKKKREREKRRNPQTGELGFAAQPLCEPFTAHCPRFPYERSEQWMVLLIDQKEPRRLLAYQKLTQNTRHEKVQLKFLAPKGVSTVQFEIVCTCSTYLGADKKKSVKKAIAKKKEDEAPSAAVVAEDEDAEEEEEEEEEPEGKWYYLGGNSVGELILNIIALAIAGVMLFNFLYAKGWWQKFCEPLLQWVLKVAWPVLSVVGNFLLPGWLWFSTNVYDFHHIAFMFENFTAANDTNASISLHVRKNDTSFLNQDPFKQDIFAEARENL
eukprot:CAMPEP_0174719936 /NCGR_PEP_ID=MMETSP1094-20130205/32377_1 /TAXON_ID=156173 /ORGANISM="Chrysochromulina brevifilum, Strain UTEX LB 985" /LENGTH=780 /DNA_ID=CAMNT_0015920341 /DNA_START=71 /DNA_END=2413 /DNA_ORIENTATION=-